MKRILLSALTVACAALALPATAQFQKPEDAVKYRQSTMTVMGNHFGRLGAMASGRAPYDAATATANAEVVAAMSRLHWTGFVEGTAGSAKGGAAAKIWSERAQFDEGGKKMETEVQKLVAAARSNSLDAIKPAFGEVGKTCKGCHDSYRNP
jgi:cytochrome c556